MWHSNHPAFDGMLTEHLPPAKPISTYHHYALTDAQLRSAIAFHEAGHVVAAAAAGMTVHFVEIADDLGKGGTPAGVTNVTYHCIWFDYAVQCAAGERAEQRWMRENGLWNPTRAWAAETRSRLDRLSATDSDNGSVAISYGAPGTADIDWTEIRDAADAFLDRNWRRVCRVAEALGRAGRLAAAELRPLLAGVRAA